MKYRNNIPTTNSTSVGFSISQPAVQDYRHQVAFSPNVCEAFLYYQYISGTFESFYLDVFFFYIGLRFLQLFSYRISIDILLVAHSYLICILHLVSTLKPCLSCLRRTQDVRRQNIQNKLVPRTCEQQMEMNISDELRCFNYTLYSLPFVENGREEESPFECFHCSSSLPIPRLSHPRLFFFFILSFLTIIPPTFKRERYSRAFSAFPTPWRATSFGQFRCDRDTDYTSRNINTTTGKRLPINV